MKEENIDRREPFKVRLIEERDELFQRTIALKNTFSNPEMKLNEQEWKMLHRQYETMLRYLQVLTDRCIYYKLIVEPANLDSCYEKSCGSY